MKIVFEMNLPFLLSCLDQNALQADRNDTILVSPFSGSNPLSNAEVENPFYFCKI